jgi:hypothetical protein
VRHSRERQRRGAKGTFTSLEVKLQSLCTWLVTLSVAQMYVPQGHPNQGTAGGQ